MSDSTSWRDLTDQLSPKQVEWLTEFETQASSADELLNTARSLAENHDERLSITAAVIAALDGSGLETENRAHHLHTAEMTLSVMDLRHLSTTELVALNGLLAPAHGRFLRKARRAGKRRRR
jgi:hypothetical protein